jgi:hypothetical protein
MSRDKQREIHDLAKQMSEAISTAVEQRYIEDEAKLEAVLRANGWRKASEVAREIFEEIDKRLDDLTIVMGALDSLRTFHKTIEKVTAVVDELKKKYTESEKDNVKV